MGKTLKKAPQPPFRKRRPRQPAPVLTPRVLREIKEQVIVGYARGNTGEPSSFWWNGEAFSVRKILKRWQDEWRNSYFRVETDRGIYDIYEHRKVISLTRQQFECNWFVSAEIEMVEA